MDLARFNPFAEASDAAVRELSRVLWLVLLIKLGWLVTDHTLRLYMGDSMVYLQTAAWLSGAPGRSYLYGAILHFTAFPLGSPLAIIVLHALWSTASALGLHVFLRNGIGVPWPYAASAAMLLALEPAQVFFERMVMAETAGLLALVATFLAYARYLQQGRLRWYLAGCVFGLAAGNFRTSMLPVIMGLGLATPLLFLLARRGVTLASAARVRHGIIAVCMLGLCHVAYTQTYGVAMKSPPGYLALTGMMRIGLVAPLIEPRHFEGTGVSGEILEQVRLPLGDHWNRGDHIWSSKGLWQALERNTSDPEAVARIITRRAMLDHPVELLRINVETLGGYFDTKQTYWRMRDDIGAIAPDARAREVVLEWMGWDVAGIDAMDTPARIYFAKSAVWLTACLFLLAPLALATLAIGWRRERRDLYALLALASLGLVASHLLFSHIVSFRYLHPFPWFVLANGAAILGTLPRTGSARKAEAPESAGRQAPWLPSSPVSPHPPPGQQAQTGRK